MNRVTLDLFGAITRFLLSAQSSTCLRSAFRSVVRVWRSGEDLTRLKSSAKEGDFRGKSEVKKLKSDGEMTEP